MTILKIIIHIHDMHAILSIEIYGIKMYHNYKHILVLLECYQMAGALKDAVENVSGIPPVIHNHQASQVELYKMKILYTYLHIQKYNYINTHKVI